MKNIYNYTLKELENELVNLGEKKYRASQIMSWLYRNGVKSFREMTNISLSSISLLEENYTISELEIKKIQVSKDETRKVLFRLDDDNYIESVLMKYKYGYSVCVSSQVGCNMGCAFCASGLHKKERNLETWEMVAQVKMIADILKEEGLRLSHVVVMGIGEPFDNYDNLIKFLEIINYSKGLEIGARHITVSTCGLVDRIFDFALFPLQVNLAISLHFPNDELRKKYMPIAKRYSLGELLNSLREYYNITNRRITIEYIMLDNINDSVKNAYELINLLRGLNCYVNLIPMNEATKLFKSSSEKNAKAFYDVLKNNGINVNFRHEFGSDIDAACGQLRVKAMKEENRWKD